MNNFDNILANEIQLEEISSVFEENNFIYSIASLIGTGIGLNSYNENILSNNSVNNINYENVNDIINNNVDQNETDDNSVDNEFSENEDINVDEEHINQVDNSENNNNTTNSEELTDSDDDSDYDSENDSLPNDYRNNNSFFRFAQSMIEFAEEGQNAFNDDPNSIPSQIYESIFSFNNENRNFNRRNNSTLPNRNLSSNSYLNQYMNFLNIVRNSINLPGNLQSDISVVLDEDVLDTFELKKFSEIDNKDCCSCTVCLLNFEDDDIVRKIKCNHIFHKKCIDEWLLNHSNKCPVCRSEMGSSHPVI